jgi:hypothetical protein
MTKQRHENKFCSTNEKDAETDGEFVNMGIVCEGGKGFTDGQTYK